MTHHDQHADEATPADDVLARLRAVDPVPEPVSHPTDGPVRATLEEILMSPTGTTTDPMTTPDPAREPGHRPRFRTGRALAVAAALLLVVGVVGAVVRGGDGDDQPLDSAAPTTELPEGAIDPGQSGPVSPGGDSGMTSCVELYDLETIKGREYAFDGTVASVAGMQMTFQVHEWFGPGEGDTVTLDHQGYEGMLFAPDGPALEPGTRVLVAGDGGFVWSCGFTQLYDPAVADQWRAARG